MLILLHIAKPPDGYSMYPASYNIHEQVGGSESLVLSVPTPTELRKQDQSLAHWVAYPQVSI